MHTKIPPLKMKYIQFSKYYRESGQKRERGEQIGEFTHTIMQGPQESSAKKRKNSGGDNQGHDSVCVFIFLYIYWLIFLRILTPSSSNYNHNNNIFPNNKILIL